MQQRRNLKQIAYSILALLSLTITVSPLFVSGSQVFADGTSVSSNCTAAPTVHTYESGGDSVGNAKVITDACRRRVQVKVSCVQTDGGNPTVEFGKPVDKASTKHHPQISSAGCEKGLAANVDGYRWWTGKHWKFVAA